MKNLRYLVVAIFALGACTETEYIEIEKIVLQKDTVTKFVDRYFVSVDTVEVPVIVPVEIEVPTRQKDSIVYVTKIQYDTIYVLRVDTLWRERIVYEYDTLVVTRHSFDTIWQTANRLYHYFPSEVIHIVQQFYVDAEDHGRTANVSYIDMRFKKMDAVLQAMSYQVDDQWHIYLNDNLSFDEMYLPIFREMARIQFGKEYSQSPESLLYPFYPANKIRWSNRHIYTAEIEELFL